ncbi:MAG: hypothetical protein VX975_07035, partial [Acidobacteriota bacterium]|nr:hypothetical protein [Acidobacteriota bacterium]
MVGIETEHVGALHESVGRFVRVVEEAIPFIAAERSTKISARLWQHLGERGLLLDRFRIGDDLSPEERSIVGGVGIAKAR